MRVFIIHGSSGSPQGNWFPWLKEELKKEGHEVIVPQFPIGEQQLLKNWLETLEPYKERLNDAVLVGHSLGAPFIIDVLNAWEVKVKATFLIAGFIGPLSVDEPNIEDFSDKEFDWEKIRSRCAHFEQFHSDNDPFVPQSFARQLSQRLGIKLTIVKKAGHFMASEGWKEFPLLKERILLTRMR